MIAVVATNEDVFLVFIGIILVLLVLVLEIGVWINRAKNEILKAIEEKKDL